MIDTHCHILPGLDDGPETWDESMDLARALAADGITEVIATPHQLGMFDNADACQQIRDAVLTFNGRLTESKINLKVHLGAEIRLDVNLLKLLGQGQLLTLADSSYMLLELPSSIYIDITPLVHDLTGNQVIPVIAHAERLVYLRKHPTTLVNWLSAGAVIQVTVPGLLGSWGQKISTLAWELVLNGHACLLATDAHDTQKRRPQLTAAHAAVANRLGEHIARRLTLENPRKILTGDHLVPLFGTQPETLTPHFQ